jgi:hypothetical protein
MIMDVRKRYGTRNADYIVIPKGIRTPVIDVDEDPPGRDTWGALPAPGSTALNPDPRGRCDGALAVDFSVEDAGKREWLWAFGSAPRSWSNSRITELGVSVKGSASA